MGRSYGIGGELQGGITCSSRWKIGTTMANPDRTYIRFVCYQLVESQRQRLGLFQAINEARDCAFAPDWALKQIGEVYGWFQRNLAIPKAFSSGTWKGSGQPGLSWFKPAAREHIRQMHQLKLALEACGVHVDILTTRDPGRIIWQDRNQLVAEPGNRRF
jgi:hypothetical protein